MISDEGRDGRGRGRGVVAMGIDAGSWQLIEELLRRGELPSFASLRREGASFRLRNGEAPRHGNIWHQFVLGREMRADRAWSRLTFDPATYETYQESAGSRPVGTLPFWERAPDRTTIAFDVPGTAIGDGDVTVTAWGAHAPLYPRASRPAGLLTEIDRTFGPHPAFDNDYHCGWHDPRRLERLADALVTGAMRRAEIACYLRSRFAGHDLFVTVMSEAHSASEFCWHGIDPTHPLAGSPSAAVAADALHRVYRALDEAVGRLAADAAATDATFLVFSLDGMKSSPGDVSSIVLLPELLHRMQFGAPLLRGIDPDRWRSDGFPPLVPPPGRSWRQDLDARLVDPPPIGLRGRVRRVPGVERALATPLGRRALGRLRSSHIGALGFPIERESTRPVLEMNAREQLGSTMFTGVYEPFWPRMRAFALPSFGPGYVRINLVGRERDGCVPLSGYRGACADVEAALLACHNPRTGHPVVDTIERPRVADPLDADGPYADLVVHWREPIDAFDHPEAGIVGPVPLHRTGIHTEHGFLLAAGPGIAPRELGERGERSALDVAPTILSLLGCEPPAEVAGAPMFAQEARADSFD